jgi:hypothetical protein
VVAELHDEVIEQLGLGANEIHMTIVPKRGPLASCISPDAGGALRCPHQGDVQETAEGHHRVRRDRVDKAGCVTLRYRSKLLHIGVGRVHAGVRVLLLVNDLDVRVITEDGELLRHLTLDPTKAYQATGRPKGPARS